MARDGDPPQTKILADRAELWTALMVRLSTSKVTAETTRSATQHGSGHRTIEGREQVAGVATWKWGMQKSEWVSEK